MSCSLRIAASLLLGMFLVLVPAGARAGQSKVMLVTGFEPFGGDSTNGSWEAGKGLDGGRYGDTVVAVRLLPVVWGRAAESLRGYVNTLKPAYVVCFGQAGAGPVRLETKARNVREMIRDNDGVTPRSSFVYPDGPPVLKTMLPIEDIARGLRAAGIPVTMSDDAGTFLCNDTFYTLMRDPGSSAALNVPRGFVHVPPLGAMVKRDDGKSVVFDEKLLRKTAEIIVRTVAGGQ